MGMICTLKVSARQKIKAASHSRTVGTSSAEDSDGKLSGLETLLAPTPDHSTYGASNGKPATTRILIERQVKFIEGPTCHPNVTL